jgi:integrase
VASYVKREGSRKPHQVRFRDHTGKSRSDQFSRKDKAMERLREVQSLEETGRLDMLDSGKQSLATVGADWFRLTKSEWSESTADEYRYLWNAVVLGKAADGSSNAYPRSAIADLPIRTIRRSHGNEFREDSLVAGVPASSITRCLSLISRTLDFAADDGLIAANPIKGVKPPKAKPRKSVSPLAPEQIEAIRAQLPKRDAVFVSLLAYSGIRPAELRALKADQISGDWLTLSHQNPNGELEPLKKRGEGHKRIVPICAALKADLASVDWDGFLFGNGQPSQKHDWDNWRKRKFEPAVTAAKVTISRPYDLRHGIASLWYREGIDKLTIADWLGHSIGVLESTYAWPNRNLDPRDKRSVDEMIAAARKPS